MSIYLELDVRVLDRVTYLDLYIGQPVMVYLNIYKKKIPLERQGTFQSGDLPTKLITSY